MKGRVVQDSVDEREGKGRIEKERKESVGAAGMGEEGKLMKGSRVMERGRQGRV